MPREKSHSSFAHTHMLLLQLVLVGCTGVVDIAAARVSARGEVERAEEGLHMPFSPFLPPLGTSSILRDVAEASSGARTRASKRRRARGAPVAVRVVLRARESSSAALRGRREERTEDAR